jgi:hypothetical protein
LNEYDNIEHTDTDKKGNRKVLFTKRIEGLVYLATIERGPYKGEVRTFWKMPDKVPSAGGKTAPFGLRPKRPLTAQ